MADKQQVDLYRSHYPRVDDELYRAVRSEAFGEDLGQTSWITAAECDELADWLAPARVARLLEVACGSGGVALRLAERLGSSVVGVDADEAAVAAAKERAGRGALAEGARFQVADANEPLPFEAGSFDAVFCNDAINHLRERGRVLDDWARLLRPGGRCLYTDPIVVTGPLSAEEIAARSSIGPFVFTPLGANEESITRAGLRLLRTADLTDGVATTSRRWHAARAGRARELAALEGEAIFEGVQAFLTTVHALASERRLSRFAFLCEKATTSD